MTSKIWVQGCKYSAIVGTIFGLLLPGLPLLAAPSGNVENFSSTPSGDLLIAGRSNGCEESGANLIAEYTTTINVFITICEKEGGGDGFIKLVDLSDGEVRTFSVNEYQYEVGSDFTIYDENGELMWSAPIDR